VTLITPHTTAGKTEENKQCILVRIKNVIVINVFIIITTKINSPPPNPFSVSLTEDKTERPSF
jgi:hypothetical protein